MIRRPVTPEAEGSSPFRSAIFTLILPMGGLTHTLKHFCFGDFVFNNHYFLQKKSRCSCPVHQQRDFCV